MSSGGVTAQPRASWIMIFLNEIAFIDSAIRSVMSQVGFDAWELILVDDGSTDGSSERAEEWATTHPDRIRYLDHPYHQNLGMSASRNLGVSHARGEFIGFLDADDFLLPETMRNAVELLDAHPEADVAIGRTVLWHSWKGPRHIYSDRTINRPEKLQPRTVMPPRQLFERAHADRLGWWAPGICSVVMRREAFDRVGGFEPSFRGLYEDQVLYAKMGLTLSAVMDDRLYALYRQHEDSTCALERKATQSPWASYPSRDTFISWLSDYIDEHIGDDAPEARVVDEYEIRPRMVSSRLRHAWWVARHDLLPRTPRSVKIPIRHVRDAFQRHILRHPATKGPTDRLSPGERRSVTAANSALEDKAASPAP